MGLVNIKKKNKKKNGQFIQSVDSYSGVNETFVYNSYPANQMPMNNNQNMTYNQNQNTNNQYPMQNQQMPMNQAMINQQMPINQPMTNQQVQTNQQMPNMVQSQQTSNQYNTIKPNLNKNETVEVLQPKLNINNNSNTEIQNNESIETLGETLEELPEVKEAAPLDPLNNANNPIPVNPVSEAIAVEEEPDEIKYAKANIFAVFGMFIGMIFKPGTTITDSIKKYKNFSKGIFITLWLTLITLVGCLAVRVVVGSFYRTYNAITGEYVINMNFNNVLTLDNYVPYLIVALLCSLVASLVIALIYYASSFFNSKGVRFGSYLAVSNVTIIPIILGVVVLNPLCSILSDYLAIISLIVPFIYSLISFIIGINHILKFNSLNSQIYYNVFNLSVIIFIIVLIVMALLSTNVVVLPDFAI